MYTCTSPIASKLSLLPPHFFCIYAHLSLLCMLAVLRIITLRMSHVSDSSTQPIWSILLSWIRQQFETVLIRNINGSLQDLHQISFGLQTTKSIFGNASHTCYLIKYVQFEYQVIEITPTMSTHQTQGIHIGIDQRNLHHRSLCHMESADNRN